MICQVSFVQHIIGSIGSVHLGDFCLFFENFSSRFRYFANFICQVIVGFCGPLHVYECCCLCMVSVFLMDVVMT